MLLFIYIYSLCVWGDLNFFILNFYICVSMICLLWLEIFLYVHTRVWGYGVCLIWLGFYKCARVCVCDSLGDMTVDYTCKSIPQYEAYLSEMTGYLKNTYAQVPYIGLGQGRRLFFLFIFYVQMTGWDVIYCNMKYILFNKIKKEMLAEGSEVFKQRLREFSQPLPYLITRPPCNAPFGFPCAHLPFLSSVKKRL